MARTKNHILVVPDPDRYGDIDDYKSYEEEMEEMERSFYAFQNLPYSPHTDDSSYYDGESYGYEG